MTTNGRSATTANLAVAKQGLREIELGLRANLRQFIILAAVNLTVGGLVGLERTTTPLVGKDVFHLSSSLSIFSFIVAFGATKAITDLFTGPLTARYSKRSILLVGWLIGAPVPLVLAYSTHWWMIILANVALGLNQGLTWSMTVNMKIDLVGPRQRGLATGINEAAGYGAVGLTALITGYLASRYGLRPIPEIIGVAFVVLGFILSLTVKDTADHVAQESSRSAVGFAPNFNGSQGVSEHHSFRDIFWETTWRSKGLRGASQAGFVSNLNDAVTWGVFPLLFTNHGLGLFAIGLIKGLYPLLWGLGQIPTGLVSDKIGRKPLITIGMAIQSVALFLAIILLKWPLLAGIVSSLLLGIGTAMVYPTLIAAVSDVVAPSNRSKSLGVYRFWRDLGYAVGAITAGLISTFAGLNVSILIAAAITGLSSLMALRWLPTPSRNSL
ncbi:MAG: MFS transporter [Actinomycetota bacterium]|nr:MFS transporter [Actinomycetota bacterium]